MRMHAEGNKAGLNVDAQQTSSDERISPFIQMPSLLRKDELIDRSNDGTTNGEGSTSFPVGNESLTSFHLKLDLLLNDKDDAENNVEWSYYDKSKYLQIKLSHWKDLSKVKTCEGCGKDFRLVSKKFNCCRCGNVYCDACCQYRKRLSPEGAPDCQGHVYRVCIACADLHIQPTGVTQNLTDLFCQHRKNKRQTIEDELNRLINGFVENVDPNSPLKSALEFLPSLKIPSWQKSLKWFESSEVEWCSKCSSNFNFLNRKHHCRLCGYVYCGKCCNMSLLLYFDESQKGLAKLIGVVGCPDKEPPVSLYLNICTACEEDLEEYQVQQYYLESTKAIINSNNKMEKLQGILAQLSIIERNIKESLSSFQEQLDTYVFEDNPNKNIDGKNNMEIFAKAHADISDLFTRYSLITQGLKEIDMPSNIELKLMQNIISVKCNLYNTDMNAFKCLKCTMGKIFPAKSLEHIQNFANTQAINNTYIMIRQLGLEALSLSSKYNFCTTVAEKLSEVDQVCFTELGNYLQAIGENQKEHIDILNDLLKAQMKEKTLVLLDEKQVEASGSAYVNSFLIQRCSAILYQISEALKAKSSDAAFPMSKQCLMKLLDFISELCDKQGKNR